MKNSLLLICFIVAFIACRKIPASKTIESDTIHFSTFRMISASGFDLNIGDSLVTPEVKFIRISENRVLQESKVRQIHTKNTTSIPVPVKIKITDKSKVTDKSLTDSKNKDKSKDKSRENSNNKTGRTYFIFWIIILIAVIVYFGRKLFIQPEYEPFSRMRHPNPPPPPPRRNKDLS